MPRPRNEELREKIQTTFWHCFREVGYDATSYGTVAQELGLTKALVQYHFPKKELLAIALMERLLGDAEEVCQNTPISGAASQAISASGGTAQDFAELFRIGQVFFAFLLQKEGYRTFLFDVIKSRDLTVDVLAFDLSWALEFIERNTSDMKAIRSDANVDRSVIVHMGGFYELLYHCLKADEPFDVGDGLFDVLEAFLMAFGYERCQAEELLAPGRMDRSELADAVAVLNGRLLF